ncbi:MAG: magnesium/cobalt transporter CorA [Myxococcota bacterium]|nr:magnesium/cobalt transporter CorA [Myxococcota bacterium]
MPPTKRKRLSSAKRAAGKRGQAPGTAIYVGEERSHPIQVTVLDYNPEALKEHAHASLDDLSSFRESPSVTWVNLDGVHDVAAVSAVCEAFGVHPLAMEDILNPGTRPKVDDYGDQVFVVAKMVTPSEQGFEVEQVSMVLGTGWVLTFQEREGDLFDPIRKRIRSGGGRIRRMGSDYLLHSVLDALVDGYFETLVRLDESTAALEDQASEASTGEAAKRVHALKRDLVTLRRLIWPLRAATGELMRSGELIGEASLPYFRDLQDHVLQVLELMDSYRDRLTGVLELQLAVASGRMNDVMQVLTIVATLFIPLTFIAGIYGMNFQAMPELAWRWGYPAVWGVMLACALGMVAYFRRRGWL